MPSMRAVTAPESGAPPAAATPMNANCEAPVNITRDSTQVCRTDSPAATETAPNETPYRPGGDADAEAVADDRAALGGLLTAGVGHAPTLTAGGVSGGG